jgi:hypothetical protein
MVLLLLARADSAFRAGPLRSTTGPDRIAAGSLDGLGGPVVLAGLPDDWVPVVLTAVVHGHPDPQGEGGFTLLGVVVADAIRAVGGDA